MKLERSGLYGYIFCASIYPNTDLATLLQHGRIEHVPEAMLGFSDSIGRWYPLDIPPIEFLSRAEIESFIGDIPFDGGDFLRFLILVKMIGITKCRFSEKIGMLDGIKTMYGQDGHAFSEFIRVVGGKGALIDIMEDKKINIKKEETERTRKINNDLKSKINEIRSTKKIDNQTIIIIVLLIVIIILMF